MMIQLFTTYERHRSPKLFCFRRNVKLCTLVTKRSTIFQSHTNKGKIEENLIGTNIFKSAGTKKLMAMDIKNS